MERWQSNKKRDLKALFLEIADRHIKFYESVRSLLPFLLLLFFKKKLATRVFFNWRQVKQPKTHGQIQR